MAQDLAYSYAAITKSEKQSDGTLKVYGKATDDSIDIDKQICDDAWLKRAMPDWFVSGGNIREQHSSIAAGVATDYEYKSDGHYITALIVDPTSVKKIENGVLKGFSIGIRGPRVIRDEKAAGGRIVDGQIVEISVVDRPANSNAKMTIAKAVDGELVAVEQTLEELVIPTPADLANKFNENHDESGRFSAGDSASAAVQGLREHFASRTDTLPTSNAKDIKEHLDQAQAKIDEARAYHEAGNRTMANNRLRLAETHAIRAEQIGGNRPTTYSPEQGHSVYSGENNTPAGIGSAGIAAARASYANNSGKSAVAEEGSIVPEEIVKFNENHDESGRFSSGDGSGSASSAPRYSDGRGAAASAQDALNNASNSVAQFNGAIASINPEDVKSPEHLDAVKEYMATATANVDDAHTALAAGDKATADMHVADAAYNTSMAQHTLQTALGQPTQLPDKSGRNSAQNILYAARVASQDLNYAAVDHGNATKSVQAESTIDKSADLLNTVGTLLKFDQATYDAACGALYDLIAIEAAEGKAGSDERDSIKELLGAIKHLYEWYEGEVSEGEVAMPNPEISDESDYDTIELSADSNKMCDKCGESDLLCKCDSMKSADAEETPAVDETPAEPEAEAEPVVEETLVETTTDEATEENSEVDRLKSALDAEIEKATRLEAELEIAKSAVVAGGPRRSSITKAVNTSEILVKATGYRNKAAATTDRVLREGYIALAADLEKSLKGQK